MFRAFTRTLRAPGAFLNFLPALLLPVLFAACAGRAAVLLRESFDYTNGPLTSASSGAWISYSGSSSNPVDVVDQHVNLTFTETEDVHRPITGQPYPAAGLTNHFYARFTVRFAALPGSGGAWFAAFKDGTTTGFRSRAFALAGGASSGKFRLGLSTANNSSATITNATDLAVNSTYNVVLRLANTNSEARLWVNPTNEGEFSIATSEAAATFNVVSLALRQNTGMGALAFDDLVVATTFEEVMTAAVAGAPLITRHPESTTALAGTTVQLFASAVGQPPLALQWLANGVPLPGQTNGTLALTNVSVVDQAEYAVVVTNDSGSVTSGAAALLILPNPQFPPAGVLTLMNYNTHGNFVADWSTNSPQVQAIGRQVQFLDPDVITFQEIPLTNNGTAQMANFVTAFRPGFFLATNSGSDGFIRSVILSRFPITRSVSWLDFASLTNFGYNGHFTRDLFETEIAVPGWPQPLHVFTTHLKSSQDPDSTAKRAAEARSISNLFAVNFRPASPLHPYILTGDMNEDVSAPPIGGSTIPTLVGPETGLQLHTPFNPFTGSPLTFSIQAASLTRRYDYVLPCALLATNIVASQVFRTGLASNIAPALGDDDVTASDHLPLVVALANPFARPPHFHGWTLTNGAISLAWSAVPGARYDFETSSNLASWQAVMTNLLATEGSFSITTNAPDAARFFRVRVRP